MSAPREPRFELVHTDAGWHSRFRAGNGRIVWATEVYPRSIAALRAVGALAHHLSPTHQLWVETKQPEVRYGSEGHDTYSTAHRIPVRVVDERTEVTR